MSNEQRPVRVDREHNKKLIGGVIAAVLLVWFILANSQQVNVTLWLFGTTTSLIVVIIISALLGAGVTFFLMRMRRSSRS